MQTYLVGGAVRDKLLNQPSYDNDYVVINSTPQQMLALGYTQIGRDFPVFLHPTTKEEYALARTDRKMSAGYNGFHVDISGISLESDLNRRDITINSIAYDTTTNTYIDPFNGIQDLENKFLRHTSDAFIEDPIRVLRIARFKARYPEFVIHKTTRALIYTMRNELQSLQPDRVWKEVEKVLLLPNSYIFFNTLFELGVLDVIFPHLYQLTTLKEGNKSHLEASVFEHTMMVLQQLSGKPVILQLAGLCHDIAKPITYRLYGSSAGHDSNTTLAQYIHETFPSMPAYVYKHTLFLCSNHVRIYKLYEMKHSSIATFLATYKQYNGQQLLEWQIELGQADDIGRTTLTEVKLIDATAILSAFDAINKYSPANWMTENQITSPAIIQQHIHNTNINFVKEYFEC